MSQHIGNSNGKKGHEGTKIQKSSSRKQNAEWVAYAIGLYLECGLLNFGINTGGSKKMFCKIILDVSFFQEHKNIHTNSQYTVVNVRFNNCSSFWKAMFLAGF